RSRRRPVDRVRRVRDPTRRAAAAPRQLLVGAGAVPDPTPGVVRHLLPVDRAHRPGTGPVEGPVGARATAGRAIVSSLATRRNLILVLIAAGVWATWSGVCGYLAHRIPATRLSRDRGLLRIRGFEAGGRFY